MWESWAGTYSRAAKDTCEMRRTFEAIRRFYGASLRTECASIPWSVAETHYFVMKAEGSFWLMFWPMTFLPK